MRRIAALAALAAVALVPAAAAKDKKPSPRAHVFKGTIVAAGADGAYTGRRFGKAQLVDNKRNDKLQVQAKHLAPRTLYQFQLAKGTVCEQGASGGTPVPGFRVTKQLKTNRKGNGSGKARSHTFKSDSSETYVVLIYTTGPTGGLGDVVACAQLKEKHKHAKKPKSHDKSSTHGQGGTHGKGHAKK